MDMESLKRQHRDVLTLAKYILEQIAGGEVEKNLDEVVRCINTISGKLKLHLMSEDQFLYPALSSSANPMLRRFGKQYGEEMEIVTGAFEGYKASYNTAPKIRHDMAGFEAASKQIFSALSGRIGREETELYPLLD
ncbi:hemerythrin domain-containing protein [Anoxybacterium hadale]|uniref:hemerythrin domain-containing protein n=1 Tax=Anoxybacterium hadale TaxID=3408580 RepID=UPI003B006CC0